jgi:mediator of RNA polymerase II transcription subunit 8
VSSGLHTLAEQLAEHQQLLTSAHVFPLPQYPGRPYGGILSDTLLRTKLEPNVQEWIEQGESIANGIDTNHGLSESDRSELWQWAPTAANKEARKQKWGADYTLEEVKNGVDKVITGLTRDLIVPLEDDDDEGDDDEYDEVTDDEEDGDKMDIERSTTQPSGGSESIEAGPQQLITGKPSYLETLQEFMTTGRIERYEPKLVEMRKEAE